MYTSGQLAARCHVSIRTVQYYDQRGLLHAQRSVGNQRRYCEDDYQRLQRILTYRQLGFTLKDIQTLLDRPEGDQVLLAAINRQRQRVYQELHQIQDQLTGLDYLQRQLTSSGNFPGNISNRIRAINTRRLHQLHCTMIGGGIVVDILIWGSLLTVIWWGGSIGWLIVGGLISLALVWGMVTVYFRHVRYLCPHCQHTFVPARQQWFFARHTPQTRQLTCPYCGQTSYCIEEYR